MHHSKTIAFSRLFLYCSLLLALLLPTFSASAAIHFCRSDPIVYLSDGTKVTMVVSIQAAAEDVSQIFYELHVPRGLRVLRVVYTGGALSHKETLTVLADNPSGLITSVTRVTTFTRRVPVIATTSLVGHVLAARAGYERDNLTIDLQVP